MHRNSILKKCVIMRTYFSTEIEYDISVHCNPIFSVPVFRPSNYIKSMVESPSLDRTQYLLHTHQLQTKFYCDEL